ncbi:MAG: autotransporter domain-containing protein [Opitutaceae bacterium]|nr:autotransporter domain-containing protein [Opitutaceae bacterium]
MTRLDGTAINSPLYVDVTQNGDKAATATYNYNAVARTDGIHLSYGVTALDILAGQSLILDNTGAAASTLAADLGGAGGIEVRASGTVTLSGGIGFTGETTVSRGALKLVQADALANSEAVTLAENTALDAGDRNQTLRNLSGAAGSALNLGAAAALTLENDTGVDTVFAGALNATAAATLTKTGSGSLTLGGPGTHGDTVISGGTLRASRLDALGSGEVTIAAGTTLEFNGADGTLDRVINAGNPRRGTLAFVDSVINLDRAYANIAAFAISGRSHVRVNAAGAFGGGSGSVSVRDGGALEIGAVSIAVAGLEVDGGALLFSSPASALTSAAGTVSFANHARVGLADGSIASGRYTFVSARSLLSDNAGNIPDYAPYQHGKRVVVTRAGGNSTAQALVFDIMDLAANPAKDAAMVFDTVLASLGAIHGRMSESLAGPFLSRQSGDPASGFWTRAFGSSANYEPSAARSGFKDWSYGIAVGCDRVLGERLLLGLWGGFATSALDTLNNTANNADADADHQLGGVYAALKLGRFHLAADTAAGLLQTRSTRDEQTGRAYGAYDGDYFAAGAELGFRLFEWAGGSLSPTAALRHIDVRFDDYTESGQGAMQVSGFNQTRLFSMLGLRLVHGFTLSSGLPAFLDARIGWQQTLRGNTGSVSMAFASDPLHPFMVETGGYAGGSRVLGLGLRAALTDSLGLGLGYDHESAAGRERHSFNATLRYAW